VTAACLRSGLALLLLAPVTGCARPQPETQPAPPPLPRDVVVLAPDPESGQVGALTVGTPAGEVMLDTASQATTLVAGQAPSPPTVLPPDEIQRLFGAALAAIPPPARRFLLYFDTGDVSLTAESRALVPDILATVKDRSVPAVSIVGHTDTTGAAAANVALGLRRAELIRGQLVAAGLDNRLVEVTSHGETNPVVPTPDNTAEARNRRVEVTVR
jgi:outer membrane protein OmpA-like peptidoglycan-associated protein